IAQVVDQRAENLILRGEIGVETAERGAGALGNAADRRVVKPLLTELRRRRVDQPAARLPTPFGAGFPGGRRLGSGKRRVHSATANGTSHPAQSFKLER